MKELVKHLWENNREEIIEKSLLNCHCEGLHSIMLSASLGKTIRLYIADKGHKLTFSNDNKMSISFHPHHCNLTLYCIKGILTNINVEEIESEDSITIDKWLYTSKITTDEIKFEKLGEVRIGNFEVKNLFKGDSLHLKASDIHTVNCNPYETTAWFVFEGLENKDYESICYSNKDLNIEDFSKLYKKPSEENIRELLTKCNLL